MEGNTELSELPGTYSMQNFSLVFQIFFRFSGSIIMTTYAPFTRIISVLRKFH